MGHRPTPEQAAILSAVATGDNLVIEAGAGTGKTSTLQMIAEQAGRARGLYLAYNRAIKDEATQRFPRTTRCVTSHGLAFQPVGKKYSHRLNGGRVPAQMAARILGINEPIQFGTDTAPLAPAKLASIAMGAVRRFCYSADEQVTGWPVPRINGLDAPAVRDALARVIVPIARRAWDDLVSPRGQLHFTHDTYLKLFQLGGPRLDCDYLMLDEAQDCQPAGTIVLTVSGERKIEDLQAGDRVISYTGKSLRLRMRGSVIDSISSRQYDGELVAVTTANGLASRYTPGHICIAKVGPAFEGRTLLYLMRRGQSWRVGVTSAHHGVNRPSSGVAGRLREESGDAIWVLAAFEDKRDALMAEATTSARYGIPEMRFQDNGQRSIGQDRLDAFWAGMGDLTASAERCLAAFGRDARYPLATRRFTEAGARAGYLLYTRASTVRACNLMDGMQVLDTRPLVGRRSQLARRADEAWTRIAVSREQYAGDIWSMEVAEDRTYIGDGIATHNCNPVVEAIVKAQSHAQIILVGDQNQSIYGWRGATDAMEHFDGKRLQLSQSFRFGPAIAAEANKWLTLLNADMRLTGFDAIPSVLGELDEADAVLCRTNGAALSEVMDLTAQGQRVALVGGGDDIRSLARAALDLQAGRGTDHHDLMAFDSWSAVREYVDTDEAGSDLKVLVDLVDRHGAQRLIDTVSRLACEEHADTVVSTAHKAKGREWNRVRVANDFREPKIGEDGTPGEVAREDAMLAYVTVTRAKRVLDRDGLSWVDSYLPGALVPAPVAEPVEAAAEVIEVAEEPAPEPLARDGRTVAAVVAWVRGAATCGRCGCGRCICGSREKARHFGIVYGPAVEEALLVRV